MAIRSLSLVSVQVESTPVPPASAVDAGANTVSGGCLCIFKESIKMHSDRRIKLDSQEEMDQFSNGSLMSLRWIRGATGRLNSMLKWTWH